MITATPVADGSRDRVGNGAGPVPARSPRRRLLAVVAVAVVVGACAARFTLHDARPAELASAPVAARAADVAELEARVARAPDDATAWQQLGVAHVRAAVRTGDPSRYDAASSALDRAEALAPDALGTIVGRGLLDLSLHRFEAALAGGQRAHTIDPFDSEALAVIVDAAVETGRYDEAAARLQDLLDLRPTLAAFSRTSYLRELHGDVEGALAALGQAETAGSGSAFDLASVIAIEGDVRLNHGDVEGAAGAYSRALAVSGDVVAAQIGLARVAAARGDLEAAIDALVTVTDRVPLPHALTELGDMQTAAGRTADAQQTYDLVRSSFRLQQASGAVVDLEAALFEADHGDPAVAVDLARAAYAERPTIHAADAMAWALRQSGRPAEAAPFVDEALRLGTRDALLHFHAAAVHADLGDSARAADELRIVFAINPTFSFVHQRAALQLARDLGVPAP